MSKLLFDEQPLVVDRGLAKLVGLNEAIVLQQVHYWLEINRKAERHFHDGRYWTYNSIATWHEDNFAFFSRDTVKRTFASLEASGVLMSANFNSDARDRTKWYSINEKALEELAASIGSKRTNAAVAEQCIGAKCTNAEGQNAPMQRGKMPQPLPKTSTETSTETSPIHEERAREAAERVQGGECPPMSVNSTIAPEGESEAGVQAHRFAAFWLAYPRKAAKQEAERAWKKIRADDVLLNKILGALEVAKNSRQWQRDAGQFIPHPATWLNQRRWEDESDSKAVPVEVAQPREPDFYEEYEQREARLRAERAPDTDEERAEMPLRFEEFWDVYPKKIAKEDALKAWLKLHPGADLRAHMMAVVTRHARRYPNDHLIARGAVWINGRLWECERWLAQAREG